MGQHSIMSRVTSSWFVTDETEETDLRPPSLSWGAATAAPTRHRASTAWERFREWDVKFVSSSSSHLGGCHCLCLLCRSDLVAARGCIYSNQRARFPAQESLCPPHFVSNHIRLLELLLPTLYHCCQPTSVQNLNIRRTHTYYEEDWLKVYVGRSITNFRFSKWNVKIQIVSQRCNNPDIKCNNQEKMQW